MTAAAYDSQESLDVLLEFDPDLDVINPSGKTALMLACQSGHVEIAVRLLDEDAGVVAGEGTSSPLHWAVDSNSINIVRRLIEYDCDVNAVDSLSGVSSVKDQKYLKISIWLLFKAILMILLRTPFWNEIAINLFKDNIFITMSSDFTI